MTTADTIAARLEAAFSAHGFAEPGVAALRKASGVTLRTLYRYFPSREAMVIGALDHRHRRYLDHLENGPTPGSDPVLAVFQALGRWMGTEEVTGCLFINALTALPDSAPVRDTVRKHKAQTRELIARRLRARHPHSTEQSLGEATSALFLIHEGQTQASLAIGPDAALEAAVCAATAVLNALLAPTAVPTAPSTR